MAKRVNTRFATTLMIVVGALIVVGIAIFIATRHTAKEYIQNGDRALAEKRYEDAARNYQDALRKDRGNKELAVKLGDVYEQLADQDFAYINMARGAWTTALEVDPGYKPALQRLLDSWVQTSKITTDTTVFPQLHDTAEKAAKADPNDLRAAGYVHVATVQSWLSGAGMMPSKVEDAIKALTELRKKDPANPDLAYYAAMARLRQAAELMKAGRGDEADPKLADAAGVIDASIRSQPQNAAVQLRASQVYATLAELVPESDPDRKQRFLSTQRATLEAARASAKPEDDIYPEVQVTAAQTMLKRKDNKGPEQVYRQWLEKRPRDQRARLALSGYLGNNGRRGEAIELLSAPIARDPDMKGVKALQVRLFERATLIELNNLRVEECRAATDPDKRAAELAKIDSDLPRLAAMPPLNTADFLKLRGKLEMLHGKNMDAVQTLEKARVLTERGRATDLDLLNQLAQAYFAVGQTGSGERLLVQITQAAPGYVPAHYQLASVYIQQGDTSQAKEQIDIIEKLKPDAQELVRLRIALFEQLKEPEQATRWFARLPEATREQRLNKGLIAELLKNYEEAIRQFEAVRAAKTDGVDPDAVLGLVQVYSDRKQIDRATQVLDEALKITPDQPQLVYARKRLLSNNPQDIEDATREIIAGNPDPYTREMQLAQLYLRERKYDEAEKHLRAADGVKHDDRALLGQFYQLYVQQRRFDDAAQYVDKIARNSRFDGLQYRTQLDLVKGDNVAALRHAREMKDSYGEFAESWQLLGQAQQAAGQFKDAISSYNSALERRGLLEAWRGKAECFYALKDDNSAKEVVAQAQRAFPGNVALRELSLNYELNFGDPTKVVTAREQLLKDQPDEPTFYLALAAACLRSAQVTLVSDVAGSQKYALQARDALSKAIEKWGDKPEGRRFFAPLAEIMQFTKDSAAGEKLLLDFAARPAEKDKPDALLMLADFYTREGKPQQAEKSLRDAWAKSNNTNVEVQLRLAALLSRLNNYDGALQALSAANAGDPRVGRQRVDVLLAANRPNDVDAAIKDLLQKSPNSPDLLHLQASFYIDNKRFDEANTIIKRLIAADANDDYAMYLRSLVQLRQGRTDTALADLRGLRDRNPRYAQARLLLANTLAAQGDTEGATRELESAIQVLPLERESRARLLDLYASATPPKWDLFDRLLADALANPQLNSEATWWRAKAVSLDQRGRAVDALESIRTAIKLAPDRASLKQDYGNILLGARDYKTARQEADLLLSSGVRDWWVYEQRALAQHGQGDDKAALADFDTALAIADSRKDESVADQLIRSIGVQIGYDEALQRLATRPEDQPRWKLLALTVYKAKADWPNVFKRADALLASNTLSTSERLSVLGAEAEGYQATGQIEKAREAYQSLLKITPNDYVALNNFAFLLAEDLHKPEDARAYSERAFNIVSKMSSPLPVIRDTHGWVLTLCGGRNVLEGRRILQAVVADLKDKPDDFPDAHYHLAHAYLDTGSPDDAQREANTALAQISKLQQSNRPVKAGLKESVQQVLDKAQQKLKSEADSR